MIGKITIPAGANVLPHELETAKALANYGYAVEFIKKTEGYRVQTADAIIDGEIWEFKAPKGGRIEAIEKNLRRAKRQSKNIVIDSFRIKNVPDVAIKREILSKAPLVKDIDRVLFVDRKRSCIDIYRRMR